MDILIGILPALLWGVGPLIATKFGGKPVEQVLGTGYGQLAIGIIIYLLMYNKFYETFIDYNKYYLKVLIFYENYFY